MRALRAWIRRLAGTLAPGSRDRDFADEIESHLQMHVDDNLRAGMTPEEARRDALLKLGGVEPLKEALRDRSRLPVLEQVVQDVRFALRQLGKSPAFTVTSASMLALGVGAGGAIFAFVDAALLKPLPYPEPARLVEVIEGTAEFPRANLSYLDYLDWKKLNRVFGALDAHNGRTFTLRTAEGTEVVPGARVTDGFFRTLGVAPRLGRDFATGEDLASAPPVVLLSHAAWQKRFEGRGDVVGQSVTLSGEPYTIVGVLPPDFAFAPRGEAEFWTTLRASGGCDLRRSCHNLVGVARLRDGVSVQGALADVQSIARDLERQYPDSNRGEIATVTPLTDAVVGDVRPILLLLASGAGLLLLIACVNVASLVLVRSESRRREIAVRGALGASRGRLIRQFLTEGALLSAAGCLLGLLVAQWAMLVLVRLVPTALLARMPYLQGLGLGPRVLAFAAAVFVLSASVFSIAPLLRLPAGALRQGLADGDRGSAGTVWKRVGSRLVVVELAIAMVLLVGAGLLGRSLHRLLQVDLGFQADHLAILRISAPPSGYEKDEDAVDLGRRIVSRVRRIPGVESVGFTSDLPVVRNGNTSWIRIAGRPYNGEHNEVNRRGVSADYMATLKAKLVRGRLFTDAEDASKPRVVVVNETLARRYFPGEDPIGQRIGDTQLSPESLKEIVGVVDDLREGQLDSEIWPAIYTPFNQEPDPYLSLVVRTAQSEDSILPSLVAAIREVDPGLATFSPGTMRRQIRESPSAYLHRSSAWLVGGFAALAFLLGVFGLYGVVAYSVSRRSREIGVRMALGARRSAVYALVLGEAGTLALWGIGLGGVGSVAAATLMRRLLFGTAAWDAATLGCVAAALSLSAMLASYVPARRAASVDPVRVLRAE